MKFLADELIPFINNNYRTANYKILMGESNSGLFTVYAFLEKPDLFNAYIASSPTLGWCSDYIISRTENLFKNKNLVCGFLYMIYGEKDLKFVTSTLPRFKDLLATKAPNSLKWEMIELEKEGHVPKSSLEDGLNSIFSKLKLGEEDISLGFEKVKQHYQNLSESNGFILSIPFMVLIQMGNELIQKKNYKKAVTLFKYLVEKYPTSVSGNLLLGDALRDDGNKIEALKYYKKVLQLKPHWDDVKKRIKDLEQKKP